MHRIIPLICGFGMETSTVMQFPYMTRMTTLYLMNPSSEVMKFTILVEGFLIYAFSKRSPSKSGELTNFFSMFIRTTIGDQQPGKFEGGYTKRIRNRKNVLSITYGSPFRTYQFFFLKFVITNF